MADKWWEISRNVITNKYKDISVTYQEYIDKQQEAVTMHENYNYLPTSKGSKSSYNSRAIKPSSIARKKVTAYIRNLTNPYASRSGNNGMIELAASPDTIEESIGSQISSESPVGAAQPVIVYTGTGARTISMTIKVYQDYLPDGYKNLQEYCTDLKQLVYPKLEGEYITPPECEFYMPGIHIIGVCTNISVSWGTTLKGGKGIPDSPDTASVNLNITETQKVVGGKVNV